MPNSKGVTVICYGEEEYWEDRKAAMDFFLEGMMACDGCESRRYQNIYTDILMGKSVARDTRD